MATEVSVKLLITGEAGDLQAKLKAIESQIRAINGGGGGGGGIDLFSEGAKGAETFQQSLRGLIGRFSALWATMKAGEGIAGLLNVGVQFNATMENARLGIGSLITAQAKIIDGNGKELTGREALNSAMAMGDDQIQRLRISGLQTAATTEQLTSAYQDAVGGGLRAGMSLDQIRKLTVQTVQAAGAMGVPMNQLNQEIRSILDGTIDRNSRVAIRLGITNADVEKWKQAGTLFENLHVKMQAFSEAGKESMNNWTVLLSNLTEASQILMGEAFKSPMKNIQAELNSVMNTIININTAQISDKITPLVTLLRDMGTLFGDFGAASIRAISEALMGMGQWWETNRVAMSGAIESFKIFMSDSLSFVGNVAKAFITFLMDSFVWFTKLPEPVKAASIAVSTFTVAVYALNSAMVAGAASGIAKIIAGLDKLVLAIRVAMLDMAGLRIAISALGGPVAWIIAGVTAVGTALYYLATAQQRAEASALSLKKQTVEKTEAFQKLLPALKAVDEAMKEKSANDTEKKQKQEAYTQSVNDLIKTFPEQARFIREQIESGKTLAATWLLVAKNKLAALAADIATAKLADERKSAAIAQSTNSGGNKNNAAKAVFRTQFEDFSKDQVPGGEIRPEQLDSHSQLLSIMEKEYESLKKQITEQEKINKLRPNPADNEKLNKLMEQRRAAQAQMDILLEDAAIRAMPHITEAQREQVELAKADLEFKREGERIRKLAIVAHVSDTKALAALDKDHDDRRREIQDSYTEKRENAENRWYEFVRGQEGDTLARKLSGLVKLMEAEERHYQRYTGLAHSQDELNKVLAERTARETVAFREQEMKKLEAAMKDLEKTKGYTFNFEEQKIALEELAKKLNISKEALAGLVEKMGLINQRKGDFSGGILAGLTEAAEAMTNKFEQAKSAIKSILSSTENAFANFFQNIIQKGMTAGQKWDALWKSLSGAVLKAITEIIAKQLVAWGIEKGIAAWKALRAGAEVVEQSTTAGAALVASGEKVIAMGAEAIAAKSAAPALIEFAVAETWAAYAGMPFVGMALASAQIAAIMGTYATAKALSFMGGIGSGAPAEASAGMNYPGYALGGVVSRPTLAWIGEAGGREVVAPENTFLDWIKNVASPAIRVPSGGFGVPGQSEYAYAGMGSRSTSIHANFEGALIIGDSADGLRKAASALRVIKRYDDRMNG